MDCYEACFMQARQPVFYTGAGVPDTVDGRFDLLLVHEFLVIRRLLSASNRAEEGREFSQALFDITFADMDQSLRDAGIGDMGVPKHVRRMMLAYNGRMHAYESAFNEGKAALEEALERNLYGTVEQPDAKALRLAADYMIRSEKALAAQKFDDICAGVIEFPPVIRKKD